MTKLPDGPDRVPELMLKVLYRRWNIRGFICTDFIDQEADFYRDMAKWLKEGRIKYREDIVDGLEFAPEAFIGLLHGKNFGKLLVRVARG
jgi:hypothetical protein